MFEPHSRVLHGIDDELLQRLNFELIVIFSS